MSYLLTAAGIVVLIITGSGIVTTVFAVGRGSGPLSGGVARAMSWSIHQVRPSRRALTWIGPMLAATTTPLWLAATWLGWSLVFQPPGSVVHTRSGAPANAFEKAYFVGYTVTTFGNGEYQPAGPVWQALSVLVAASGFIVITLGLSYLTALLSALIKRRSTASQIHALGGSPVQLCLTAWNGRDLHQIASTLQALSGTVSEIAQQRLAYPMLRRFHSGSRGSSIGPALAKLDEALSIMCCALPASYRPDPVTLTQVRNAITSVIAEGEQHRRGERPVPPPPDIGPLRAARLPVASDERFRAELRELDSRRRGLRLLVEEDGWSWEDVDGGTSFRLD